MKRPVTRLTILLLVVLAALQVWLAVQRIDVVVAGLPVPTVGHLITGLVALALAIGLWLEGRRAVGVNTTVPVAHAIDVAPSPPTTTQRPPAPGVGSRSEGGHFESVMVGGKPVPAAYFMFASNVLPATEIRQAMQKYGRVLVGFDAGYVPLTGDAAGNSFRVARDLGAELEIYVEGPGGPTGDTWSADEAERVRVAADSVGIDTSFKGWRERHWDTEGWKAFTFRQLESYTKLGFNAAEIDNIERVIKGSARLIAFYKEYAGRQSAGHLPQLVMKNISAEDMRVVVDSVRAGALPRSMFSEFHIYECGNSDEWADVDRISRTVGIRTVPSRNTYEYAAKGKFGLQDEFDRAYGQDGAKPTPASA